MNTQTRIYLTLSPRVRKALELCAALDGSTSASYGAILLSDALMREIENSPALLEHWRELEREALRMGSWDGPQVPVLEKETSTVNRQQTVTKGWFMAGSNQQEYEMGVDEEEKYQGKNSAYLRAKAPDAEGFGNMMQMFKAESYKGKRMLFSANVKLDDVVNSARLWMRVDGVAGKVLAFDNMQNRPIKGTTDWRRYSVVLDVPEESVHIAFGVLIVGSGHVRVNDSQFTEVGRDVPVTDVTLSYGNGPENLDFGV